MQKTLCVFSKKNEYDSVEPLRPTKYQYVAGLMTTFSPPSEKVGTVNVDSVLEHLEKERFFKNKSPLAGMESLHPRRFIEKLATSEQPGPCCVFWR